MPTDAVHAFPSRPASEIEWEDLLVRLELMQRALRVVLEEAPGSASELDTILSEMVERERRVAEYLERAAGGDPGPGRSPAPIAGPQQELLRQFGGLRSRNFAMVQRRGIDVWNWAADVGAGPFATVYQVLTWLAEGDVEALASIRRRAGSGAATC